MMKFTGAVLSWVRRTVLRPKKLKENRLTVIWFLLVRRLVDFVPYSSSFWSSLKILFVDVHVTIGSYRNQRVGSMFLLTGAVWAASFNKGNIWCVLHPSFDSILISCWKPMKVRNVGKPARTAVGLFANKSFVAKVITHCFIVLGGEFMEKSPESSRCF